jgi:hypothetical protein
MIEELSKIIKQQKDNFEIKSNNGKLMIAKLEKQKTFNIYFCKPDDNNYVNIGTINNVKMFKKFFEGKKC